MYIFIMDLMKSNFAKVINEITNRCTKIYVGGVVRLALPGG